MRCHLLVGAVVLLTGEAGAAPKALDDQMVAHVVQRRTLRSGPDPGAGASSELSRPMYHQNGTNTTSSAASGTGGMTSRTFALPNNTSSNFMSPECPTSAVTSTTTVDVTFYITATTSYGSNLTSYSGTGTAHPSVISSLSGLNSTVSSSSMRPSSGLTRPANSSTTIASAASESPCSEDVFSTSAPHNTTSRVEHATKTTSISASQSTKPCDDDLGFTSRLKSTAIASISTLPGSTVESRSVTPCDDETGNRGSLTSTQSSTGYANQTFSYRTVSGKSQGSSIAAYTSASASLDDVPSSVSTIKSTTAKPCDDESSTITSAAPSDASSYTGQSASASSIVEVGLSSSSDLATSSVLTATSTSIGASASLSDPATSAAVTSIPPDCVIDTSMAPVTSAVLTSVPSSTLVPTKTVCQNDAPTGKPMPGNHHCGVHGLPVGNYFLARFVENSPGVPVTLEGCYQYCASVMNATDGCKSYRFYPERGLNVPRCDLYGSNVAYALDSINNDHPDLWFDLVCGSPSDPKWVHLPGTTRLRDLGLLE